MDIIRKIVLLLLISRHVNADPLSEVALALSKTDKGMLYAQNSKKWAVKTARSIGLREGYIIPVAATANSIASKKISTKVFNLKYSPLSALTVSPNAVYDVVKREYKELLLIEFKF